MELRKPNILYLFFVVSGILIWYLSSRYNRNVEVFYGFAETKETEINMDHPVVVDSIYVLSGDFAKKGDILAGVSYVRLEEQMGEGNLEMEQLEVKAQLYEKQRRSEIDERKLEKRKSLKELETDLEELEREYSLKQKLLQDLNGDSGDKENSLRFLDNRIERLREEMSMTANAYEIQIQKINREIDNNPYRLEIQKLESSLRFDEERKVSRLKIVAPSNGLIGNVHVREKEHVQPYRTLITFYEPNPSVVKGYVHEDMIVKVSLNDSFLVQSIKNPDVKYTGVVSGLGSRIVEIPGRLRRFQDMKSYGREVLIQIPGNNEFLQKEKVVLNFIN